MRIPDNAAGKRVKCPTCAAAIQVPEVVKSGESASPAPETFGATDKPLPPATMLVACPTCSTTVSCKYDMAGQKVKCTKCGQRILVPNPPPQTKAGSNKTTLGKIVDDDPMTVPPVATEAPPPYQAQPPPLPAEPMSAIRVPPWMRTTPPPLPPVEENTIDDPEPQFVSCPFCKGKVPRDVIRCKHCGETLDTGARSQEEARREAEILAQSTDVFGVVGFIIGLFSVASLALACYYGLGVVIAIPLGIVGGGCSLFGRGNLRVAGIVINGIAIFIALIIGDVWLLVMITAAN